MNEDKQNRNLIRLAWYCFFFSLVWHIIAAWFSIGFMQPDEYFQVYEFAGYKSGISPLQTMPWELKAMIRPALQPCLILAFQNLSGHWFSPAIIQFIFRLFSSFTGMLCLAVVTYTGLKILVDDTSKKMLLVLSAILWCFPIIHAHFSSENLSGSLFFIGLSCTWLFSLNKKIIFLPLAGFLLGLSLVFRLQTGFMVAGIFFWTVFIARLPLKKLIIMYLPCLLAVFIGMLADRWFYGIWLFTGWNYFKVNMIDGVASTFGILPWWAYFKWGFIDLIPPFSLVIIAGIFYGIYKYPRSILSFAIVPFLIGHLIIGHKEMRFLSPLINAVPLLLAMGWQRSKIHIRVHPLIMRLFIISFCVFNFCYMAISSFTPADDRFGVHKFIYDHYNNKDLVMLCPGESPYECGMLQEYFDMPRQLTLYQFVKNHRADSIIQKSGSPVIVLLEYKKSAAAFALTHPGARLVYRFIPAWMDNFNFNHWMDRTRIWYIYEM